MLNSVYCRRAYIAIILTLLELTAYLVISFAVSRLLIGTGIGVEADSRTWRPRRRRCLRVWVNAGNPLTLFARI